METKEKVDGYVELYELLNGRVKNAEVVAAIIEQIGKDVRCELLMDGRANGNGHSSGSDVPATEKQLGYLRSLGVEIPERLSKREASELIDQHAG